MFARVVFAIAVAAVPPLFSSYDLLTLQLKAPLNELFEHARKDEKFTVEGTLSYADGGNHATLENVRVGLRGHTSRNESECSFPKLKVEWRKGTAADAALLAGLTALKIGTHCGEAPDDDISVKYGRLPNERSPLREAFAYRLLEAVGVPSLKARPARITYVYTDPKPGMTPPQDQPVVRHAMILEDDNAAIERFGGKDEITETEFSNAREQFDAAATVQLIFAEALIGNFDWCLKMTPDDRFRCDARHPLWNITTARLGEGRSRPIIHDFDVSGMVAGRHAWFKDVFSEAFSGSGSQAEVEVLAQLQRTRSLFPRHELDAARAAFIAHKSDAYRALDAAVIDSAGKDHARRYMDAFFGAIESDASFYRPVVAAPGATPHARPDGQAVCPNAGDIPVGTPVSEPLQKSGSMIQVRVLDALWRWAPPVKCAAMHEEPVWIRADAVGTNYPEDR
jgi:hypothetical protein